MTELCNVLSLAKSFCNSNKCSDPYRFIDFAAQLIRRYIVECEDEEQFEAHVGLLRFVCEQ